MTWLTTNRSSTAHGQARAQDARVGMVALWARGYIIPKSPTRILLKHGSERFRMLI